MLSHRTTSRSINTIKDSLQNKKEYKVKTYLHENIQYIDHQGQIFTTSQIKKNIQDTLMIYKSMNDFLKSDRFKSKSSINNDIQNIKKIASLCKEKNVKLVVYISPIFSEHLKLIQDLGLEETYAHWKKEIANITDYTDFSLVNSITKNLCNFRDSSHVTSKIGPLIFARIFNRQTTELPKDFGVLITNENVEKMSAKQNHILKLDFTKENSCQND